MENGNQNIEKRKLIDKLINEHAFWSYKVNNAYAIKDETLIEGVLLHLDIEDIIKLYHLYPKKKLMEVWKKKLIPNEHYYSLNRFYAFWLFDIKNENRYLQIQLNMQKNEL